MISQMVHRFVPLVRVTVDVDDLKNIASLALIQAAHGFDPVAGMSFESYARIALEGHPRHRIKAMGSLDQREAGDVFQVVHIHRDPYQWHKTMDHLANHRSSGD